MRQLLREHGFTTPRQLAETAVSSDRLQSIGLSDREHRKLIRALQPLLQQLDGRQPLAEAAPPTPTAGPWQTTTPAAATVLVQQPPVATPIPVGIMEYDEDESDLLRESREALQRATSALEAAEEWGPVSVHSSLCDDDDEDELVGSGGMALASGEKPGRRAIPARTSHSVRWMHSGRRGTEAILDIGTVSPLSGVVVLLLQPFQ